MTTVLISGANRGIGLELARQYGGQGAQIIAGVRDPEAAETLRALPRTQVHRLDVGEDASVDAFRQAVGDQPVDILIANAGVFGEEAGEFGRLNFDVWLDTFNTNSLGPVRLAQALAPNLKAGRDKKLVAITSSLGSISEHGGDMLGYRASKAALNSAWVGLSKALRPDGIACLLLHPGWVQTDMGGPHAAITVEQSVTGLRARIAEGGLAQSGEYIAYDGRALAW